MCGIAGIFRFDRPDVPPEDMDGLLVMSNAQVHRGPDDSGLGAYGPCALASQRLAILDLSPHGHMPMLSRDGTVALVYNGEIYTYLEIREQLRTIGREFVSEGDTEVVLQGYQQWGTRALDRFVGMWAFALYDADRRTLVLSRDRFGIKPLYVHQTPERLVFASEIKAIVAYLRARGERVAPNPASIATYAATGLVDGLEDTFFEGIRRFPAAETWLVSAAGIKRERYWDLVERVQGWRSELRFAPDAPTFERLRRSLDESVRVHLRSDVPVGVCLSGGLDSSAVVGLASSHVPRVDTYTVYFADGPRYDERQHSRAIVQRFGAQSHEERVEVQSADLLPTLQRIVWHLDEPSLALGVYPQWHVMQMASKGVKVVLDGQGGDEVFGGYLNYLPQHLYGLADWVTAARFGREAVGIGRVHGLPTARNAALNALRMRMRAAPEPSVDAAPDARLLADDLRPLADVSWNEWRRWPDVFPLDWLSNVLYWELTKTRLPALLRYEDRLSMAFSIESRVPFLDHRVVEMAFGLPGTSKIRDGWTKYALRRATDGLLPPDVVWRKDKKGFPTPVGHWLRDGRGAEARALLRDPARRSRAAFPTERLEPFIAAHEAGAADYSWQLWRALSTEVWLEAFDLCL